MFLSKSMEVRVSDCFLMPTQQFFSYIMVIFQYDDEVRFVLDQHALLDFYSASWLKQQSADRHIAPLRHIKIDSEPTSLCSFSLILRA